jgi:ABC transport system ATP-binding/permease protein
LTQKSREQAIKPKAEKSEKTAAKPKEVINTDAPKTDTVKKKLSYKEQRELDSLPNEIALLEQEQAELQDKLADGSWFVSDMAAATQASERLNEIDDLLLEKMARWSELDD